MRWIPDRGFRITIKEIFESVEARCNRGDYKSKIVGYYFHVWIPAGEGFKRMRGESEEYPTREIAIHNAEGTIDAIVDSLE